MNVSNDNGPMMGAIALPFPPSTSPVNYLRLLSLLYRSMYFLICFNPSLLN